MTPEPKPLHEELRALAESIGAMRLVVDSSIEYGIKSGAVNWRSALEEASIHLQRRRDKLSVLAARAEREEKFLEASNRYAGLMRRDARNAHDPAKVQREIDRARHDFYETHRALTPEDSDGG